MKRDFLQGLGLSDDAINQVMAEHGKTINDLQTNLTAANETKKKLEEDLTAANDTISTLQKSNKDNEDLQKQIDDYQEKLKQAESQRAADRKQSFIELGLTKAGVKNSKAVSALLDLDKITEGEDGFSGLDDQLKALKESDSYLFNDGETGNQEPTPPIFKSGNPNGAEDNNSAFDAILEKY